MKKKATHASSQARRSTWLQHVGLMVAVGLASSAGAQEILFQETFEDDGSESRYTVEGGAVYELVDIRNDDSLNPDMAGPIYWARNTEVSFVGVPAPRRSGPSCPGAIPSPRTMSPTISRHSFWMQ